MQSPTRAHTANESIARILEAATALFAERGFHGVTTRQIAAAAGLNIATVHHHVGTKRELYRKVYLAFAREDEAFVAEIEALFARADPADATAMRRVLDRVADRVVMFAVERPVRARLMLRHWLTPDRDFISFDADHSLRMFRRVRQLVAKSREAGTLQPRLDIGLLLRSLDWMVYGYVVSGAFDWKTWRDNPAKARHLRAFKRLLREYLTCMFGLGH